MWFCLPQNIKIVVDAIHVNMSDNVTLALLQRLASVRAKSFKVARQPNPHSMNICPRHQATRQNIRQALYPPAPTSLHLQQNGPPPPPYLSIDIPLHIRYTKIKDDRHTDHACLLVSSSSSTSFFRSMEHLFSFSLCSANGLRCAEQQILGGSSARGGRVVPLVPLYA